jgi:pyrroline-5-carboxylate reductase
MGSMLINGLIDTKTVSASNLYVSNRSPEKLADLPDGRISVCSSNSELAKACDLVFICIKPLEIKDLLLEIKKDLTDKKHIISIAGSLTIENIEKIHSGKISRILPTFISSIYQGVTLICHNSKVQKEDALLLEEMINKISTIKYIPENEFELVSDLTSCAPGLIAEIFKEYVDSAIIHTSIDRNEIKDLVINTLFGTAKLFYELTSDFDAVIQRVATKGGATEAGIEVLEKSLPVVFDEMFVKTLERQHLRKRKIDEMYTGM